MTPRYTVQTTADCEILQHDIDNLLTWSDQWQLKFNASQCKTMHMGHNNTNFQYTMDSGNTQTALETTLLEKDLGVFVDTELKFSPHVQKQENKANQILGLIRRSFTYLDKESLKRLFIALVRPHLEYANVVWSPRFVKDCNLIENVLRRATKLIGEMRDLSYSERLTRLDIPSMSYRRMRGDMIEVWKYLHGKYSANQHFFQCETHSATRGHPLKLRKSLCQKSTRANFFPNRIINAWNKLPTKIVTANTINSFKNTLDSHWAE
ncbi:uncharacterized protein LOC144435555 [Glandiceps talaboti]